MNQVITVFELFTISGDELGRYQENKGWFKTRASAEEASQSLGHPYWEIQPRKALELESGEVYILSQETPISFGMKRLRR